MNHRLPSVLVVDDEQNMRLSILDLLSAEKYAVKTAVSAEQAMTMLENETFFAVITDVRLGGMSGTEFMKQALLRWPDLPFLMITAHATPRLAVEAIKAGATEYLPKPFAPEELLHAVKLCSERYLLLKENASLRASTAENFSIDRIIGSSQKMRDLRQFIQTVAPSDATVLILGESGTGKELIAGALHNLSKRHKSNYVRINCAAIPETLLESELFGYERGAFTGALKQKMGRVEEADEGTIFLDELGDMSRSLQAKLLRFLEDGTFTRVGGNEELKVDVRLIAATNRNIIEAIQLGQFREDLFHRLNVVQFRPCPLRDRGNDILELADHFLAQFCSSMGKKISSLTESARRKLMSHHWPGNVRELRNVIERAVIIEPTSQIQASSLPDFTIESSLRKPEPDAAARKQEGAAGKTPPDNASIDEYLAKAEHDFILSTLERHQFNLTRAAEQLKISRHALRYRVQRLNIPLPTGSEEDTASA